MKLLLCSNADRDPPQLRYGHWLFTAGGKSHNTHCLQVMDPARVPPKVQASAKANTILVSFLGDNTYNRLKPDCLKPFEGPHFQELCSQKTKTKARARIALADTLSPVTASFPMRRISTISYSTLHRGLHDHQERR